MEHASGNICLSHSATETTPFKNLVNWPTEGSCSLVFYCAIYLNAGPVEINAKRLAVLRQNSGWRVALQLRQRNCSHFLSPGEAERTFSNTKKCVLQVQAESESQKQDAYATRCLNMRKTNCARTIEACAQPQRNLLFKSSPVRHVALDSLHAFSQLAPHGFRHPVGVLRVPESRNEPLLGVPKEANRAALPSKHKKRR